MVLLALVVRVLTSLFARTRDEHGQTTAEYALVLLGAMAVGGLLIAWATQSHAVSRLFDVVVDRVVRTASAGSGPT
jgi:Flp pilus assembly pilin Flp